MAEWSDTVDTEYSKIMTNPKYIVDFMDNITTMTQVEDWFNVSYQIGNNNFLIMLIDSKRYDIIDYIVNYHKYKNIIFHKYIIHEIFFAMTFPHYNYDDQVFNIIKLHCIFYKKYLINIVEDDYANCSDECNTIYYNKAKELLQIK